MAKKSKKHPGVHLLKVKRAGGRKVWVARWYDPDTGDYTQEGFHKLDITTKEQRESWAADKSKAITDRLVALSRGSTPHTGESLADAIEYYFQTKGKRLGQKHTWTGPA